jgi:hypothetical protein
MARVVTVDRIERGAGAVASAARLTRAGARVDHLALLALLVGVVAAASGALLVRLSETGPSATAAYRMGLAVLAV